MISAARDAICFFAILSDIFFYEELEAELIVFDLNESRNNHKSQSLMKGKGLKLEEFKKVESISRLDPLSSL